MERLKTGDHVRRDGWWIDRGGGVIEQERGIVERTLPSDGTHQARYMVKMSDGIVEGPFNWADLEKESDG